MNVLLSSVGRRNYLVNYFRSALRGDGLVFASDASEHAPALEDADAAIQVPPFGSPDYVRTLSEICRKHAIKMVLPLNDLELPVVARAALQLYRETGAVLAVSPPSVVNTCLDKLASLRFLQAIGMRTPATYTSLDAATIALRSNELKFPVVVKPRHGSGSIGLFFSETYPQLEVAVEWSKRAIERSIIGAATNGSRPDVILIQQALSGPEYGFDVINDLGGRYVSTLARLKLTMRGGETDKAMTVTEPGLTQIARKIGSALGHVGVLDCDAILTSEGWVVIDMNPRFGGGYPFSHAAGANVPSAMLAWVAGEEADPRCFVYCNGVLSTKTHCVVTIRGIREQAVSSGSLLSL